MKILQFGTGVFIRGYFDWMLQEVFEKGLAKPEVSVVKLTPRGDLSTFKNQDGKFHVVIRGLENGQTIDEIREVDRLKEFYHPYQDWYGFLASAQDPDYKLIVSNSTEAGLVYEVTSSYSVCPSSFPAKLYAWLKKRFESLGEAGAVTIMAFELIPDNATKLKEIILKLASDDQASEDLLSWLDGSCSYVNTLVDRIVSKLPKEDADKLQNEHSVKDELILCAEPYHLLAIDSKELESVLPLKACGLNVEVTDDLDAIRQKKVKILNGAHMLVVPAGLALGKEIVLETLEDSLIESFANSCLRDEVAATVDNEQVQSYVDSVIERFRNPFLNHRLENIALNSSAKIGQRLLPSIVDHYKQKGIFPKKVMIAVAVFLEFYQGREIEAGKLETNWGILSDDSESMKLLTSLHGIEPQAAAELIVDKGFWSVPANLENVFIQALAEAIGFVRSVGIRKSLEG
ncbi:MAG: tagaturonate reductase [Lentisphaeraceae bacterium]|nr:tagaturonate reductase [Lentisphaeraceae bacterium]